MVPPAQPGSPRSCRDSVGDSGSGPGGAQRSRRPATRVKKRRRAPGPRRASQSAPRPRGPHPIPALPASRERAAPPGGARRPQGPHGRERFPLLPPRPPHRPPPLFFLMSVLLFLFLLPPRTSPSARHPAGLVGVPWGVSRERERHELQVCQRRPGNGELLRQIDE